MSIKARLVCVTNQDELDRALEAAPDDEVAIEIRSDPGKYVPNYLFVADSRGHYIEARGESRVVVSNTAEIVATDHSQVEAHDESIVAAIGGAQVNWRDHSTGSCGHYARGQVWDEASVSTHSEYPLLAFDDATVTVGGRGPRGCPGTSVRDCPRPRGCRNERRRRCDGPRPSSHPL